MWTLGAPLAFDKAELAFTTELRDPSDATLGSETFHAEKGFMEGLYYHSLGPTASARLVDAYQSISPEFHAFLRPTLAAP